MKKALINSEKEYRNFCFSAYNEYKEERIFNSIQQAFGIIDQSSCWDYNDKGEPVDEAGAVLKAYEAPEDLLFEDWVKDLSFPLIIVHSIDIGFDRFGDVDFCVIEFVELKEFNL